MIGGPSVALHFAFDGVDDHATQLVKREEEVAIKYIANYVSSTWGIGTFGSNLLRLRLKNALTLRTLASVVKSR